MNLSGFIQNAAAIAIVVGAAAWLLRRAVRKKSAPQGCENCPAHRPPRRRAHDPAHGPTRASRSERV